MGKHEVAVGEEERHDYFMRRALSLGQEASRAGEVPVGALLVVGQEVVASSYNGKERMKDPTAHAEILAIREGANRLGRWRLTGADLYVTLEPCAMCAGALIQARVSRLIFGAHDPKAGGCGSVFNIVQQPRLNHRVEVITGVLGQEVQGLLQSFFGGLRQRPTERWPSPVEGACLESRCGGNSTGGSNPSLSANSAPLTFSNCKLHGEMSESG
jgi:tRNA(adenine34) deaminase